MNNPIYMQKIYIWIIYKKRKKKISVFSNPFFFSFLSFLTSSSSSSSPPSLGDGKKSISQERFHRIVCLPIVVVVLEDLDLL